MQLHGIQYFNREATNDDENKESYDGYSVSNSNEASNTTHFMKFMQYQIMKSRGNQFLSKKEPMKASEEQHGHAGQKWNRNLCEKALSSVRYEKHTRQNPFICLRRAW